MKSSKAASNRKRTLSRLIALQILYQHAFFEGAKSLSVIKEDIIENYALSEHEDLSSYSKKIDQEFLENLLNGIFTVQNLEDEIRPLLGQNYSMEKLDSVLKHILLLAVFELKFMLNTPFKVIIAEYVDIAASFFDEKKVTFVNAILENLAKKLREC